MSMYTLIFISQNPDCKKLSGIFFESFSSYAIPGGRNVSIFSFTKEGSDQFTMPASTEPIKYHIKANEHVTSRTSSEAIAARPAFITDQQIWSWQ